MESLSSGCAPDGGAYLDVVAGKAALAATTAASMGCFKEGWLELCGDQKILKVLWSAVSNERALWDGLLEMLGGMEYQEVILGQRW